MSHEILAFPIAAGQDVDDALEAMEADAVEDAPIGKERLPAVKAAAAEIIEALAGASVTAEDDRGIEITSPTLQILLAGRQAGLGIDDLDDPATVRDAATALAVIRTRLGFALWDPQSEELLGEDLVAALSDG
jgi:hypothetical protein